MKDKKNDCEDIFKIVCICIIINIAWEVGKMLF